MKKKGYVVHEINKNGEAEKSYLYFAKSPYEAMTYHLYNLGLSNDSIYYGKGIYETKNGYGLDSKEKTYWIPNF